MPKVHMMIGIPGSGKSYEGKKIAEREKAIYLSSDELRKEKYGDESVQIDNQSIFVELEKRIKEELLNDNDVVYDATNISRKRRISFIKQFQKYGDVHGHVILTDYSTCVGRDLVRERTVGKEVIKRMYKNFQMPLAGEGFTEVDYVLYKMPLELSKLDLEQVLKENVSYEELFCKLRRLDEFNKIWEMPQDSTYHSFSVSRHSYYVYDSIHKEYNGEKKLEMLLAAIFHDLGKGICKSFYNYKGDKTRYANFIGHENVSAYVALNYLWNLGFDAQVTMSVIELISLHMYPKNMSPKVEGKLRNWIGEEQYHRLLQFNEYDNKAK